MKKLLCKIFGCKTVYVVDVEAIVSIPYPDFDYYTNCTVTALYCKRCKKIHFIEYKLPNGKKLAW